MSPPEHDRNTIRAEGATRAALEWTLVLLAAPVLAFPSAYPWLTLGVLTLVGATMAIGAVFCRQTVSLWKQASPLGLPWAILAIWMLVGAFISPFPALTLPKLAGMLLGMLVLRAVLLTGTTSSRIWALAWAYLLVGTSAMLGGLLVSPQWGNKFEALYRISAKIPRIIPGLPGAEKGVNPNALGGSVLLFFPLVAMLVLDNFRAGAIRAAAEDKRVRRRAAVLKGAGYTLVGVTLLLVLVLSQSRAAWISAAVAVSLAVGIRFRASFLLCAAAATLGLIWWLWSLPRDPTAIGEIARPLCWSLALQAIRAHPIAGVGLGAFRNVADTMQVGGATVPIHFVHAHNVFLQTALDVGIPGLVAYVVLLGLATRMTYQILSYSGNAGEKALCLGLWASLVAVHVFGLTDAIALGAKVGVFLWWNLGMIAALHNVARRQLEGREGAWSVAVSPTR